MQQRQTFEDVVEWAGTQANLARILKVEKAAVNWWRRHGIPARRAIQLEELSGGKFKASLLVRRDAA